MPYRVRAFCTGSLVPTLAQVFEYAKTHGVMLEVDETYDPTDLESHEWSDVEIIYKAGKGPLVVECNRNDGTDDCLAQVEPQEYIDAIGPPGMSLIRRRVIKHLRATEFIIASQLLSDIDDDGYEANGRFLEYFVGHCGGMIHADGEGFYDGDKVILKVM